jgi:tetratricopeptide (TPR) repeat protein
VEPPPASAAEGLSDVDKDRLSRLTTDIIRNPNETFLWQQRAEFLGNRGRFEAATADFDKVLAAGGVDHWSWFIAIPAYIQTGDVEKYRRYCADMQRWFEDSTDRTLCERLIRICTLLPGALADMRLLRGMAERVVVPEEQGDSDIQQWRFLARGMFDYRLGNFDAAADWLAKPAEVENRSSGRHISRQAIAVFFLAMVEHQRGRPDQARSLLIRGSQIIASDGPKGSNWFPFYDWVHALEARRQAEELVGRSVPPTTHSLPIATTRAIDPLPPSAADGLGEADGARLSKLTADILENATESAWLQRAMFLGEHGRFELAARDFQKALANGLGDPHAWFNAATVYVRIGDEEGYRRICAQVLSQYGNSTDRNLCEHVAKTCSILPGALADMEALAKVADRAVVPQTPEDPRMRPYRDLAKGMVEYRLGHFDEAVKWLRMHAEQTSDKERRAMALGFLAMTEFRRGNLDQARSALRQASETIASDGPKGDNWHAFRDWIVAVEARRQAEQLIAQGAAPSPPASARP